MMLELMQSIFGTYTPNTYTEVSTNLTTGELEYAEVIASGAAGVDWEYIGGVFLFGLAMFCVFRLIGTIFKNG
ncbi:MAG: hypothetical protein Q4E60_11360 [Bacteroidales bacterium]|nr:hypothetical protein [Bacteroidales bacterium]